MHREGRNMRTLNFLLSVIAVLLLWICINTTPGIIAGDRWTDVNISAVGGHAIYGKAIPTE